MDDKKPEEKKATIREDLGKACTQQELDSLVLIRTKSETATAAARPDAIPDGTPADKGAMFIQGALALKAEAATLEKLWWEEMTKKYALNGVVWIDFSNGSFDIMKEKDK